MRTSTRLAALAFVASTMVPAGALAGGYEYPALGTRPLGRAGAFAARADDPLALLYDPANLADLSGTQLMLNLSMSFFDACYTRRSSPTNSVGDATPVGPDSPSFEGTAFEGADFAGVPWPTLCNDGPPTIMPTLLFSSRLSPEWGIGGGLLVPSSVGTTEWGNTDAGTAKSGGLTIPGPSRYQLLKSQVFYLQPTVGVAYAPDPMIRFGLSVQWGVAFVDFQSNTAASGDGAIEDPISDVKTGLVAKDLFVPGFTLSAHAVPHDNLDVVLAFRWEDAIRAGGHIDFETGAYGVGDEEAEGQIPRGKRIDDVTFTAPIPWKATFAIRYADRIAPRPRDPEEVERLSGRVEDAMANEWWDLEFDAVYEASSSLDQYTVDLPDKSEVTFSYNSGTRIEDSPVFVPSQNVIPHNWKDQLSLRLGGDYNLIPGMVAARLGVSFETSAIRRPYMQLDYWPVQRAGLHGGLTVRLGRFDISLAYAHFFQQTVHVSTGEAELPQIVAVGTGAPMNAGTYESDIDVMSLGVTWHL